MEGTTMKEIELPMFCPTCEHDVEINQNLHELLKQEDWQQLNKTTCENCSETIIVRVELSISYRTGTVEEPPEIIIPF